jgi:nickel-dependent lactate racemase
MRVHLAYGRDGLDVELPDPSLVLMPERVPALADPGAAVRQALRAPIASPPLRDLVRPGQTAAVVFSDLTRPVPNDVLLRPLLAELEEAGVRREDIILINALGMHRRNTSDELEGMLGVEFARRYRVVQHDPLDVSRLEFVCTTERGTRVEIDSAYLRADVRVLTGFIEPHVFAGYSGGGKAVLPGIANADAITANHSGPMLAHPQATWCSAQGNPVFEEIREAALATRPTMLLNVTLNERKEVTGVFAGELAAAHDAGIAFAQRVYVRRIPHAFDIAVSTNLGYPSDLNLYQSYKGVSVAALGVRDGGAVILAAECCDGLGLPHFRDLLSMRDSPQGLLAMVEAPSFRHFDQWGVQIGAIPLARVEGHLYSSLPEEDARLAKMVPCADVGATVAALAERYRREDGGREPSVLVLPFGQLTVPLVG